MSPTTRTFVALNDQLNKAHHRIRELEARETELLAQNKDLCTHITEQLTAEEQSLDETNPPIGPPRITPPPKPPGRLLVHRPS